MYKNNTVNIQNGTKEYIIYMRFCLVFFGELGVPGIQERAFIHRCYLYL